MRFAYVSVVVVFGGLAVLGGVRPATAQDDSLGRVARRDPAPANDDFLPLPSTGEKDDDESSWWKPSMPKLSMPKIERPKTPTWVKKMNQNTREAVDKTKSAMTAPFQAQPKKQAPKRPARKEESQGFWSRMFGPEEPKRPTTVEEFIGGDKVRP
ncbi:MAG: hypothetical protein U0795_11665 [Pirellulales bacterium]